MNWLPLLGPIGLGAVAVLQAGINRKAIPALGLGGATMLNTILLTVAALVLVQVGTLPMQVRWAEFKPWFLIPGFCGLALVVGLPLAVGRWGAMPTFLWVVSSQIVVSAVWDATFESQPLSARRIVGGALALVGSWIATR